MQSGRNVFTEKPISISSSGAEEMIRVSAETGKKLGVCFQNRYNNTSVKLKELLDSGKLGRIIGAKAFVTWQRGEEYYASGDWRGTWDKEGGGVLINQSIHTLDLLQWLLGDIDKLKGTADTRLLGKVIEVEDTAEATIIFKNGATALFYATNCYVANSPVEIEIICEKAQIKLTGDLTINYNNGEVETISQIDVKTGKKAYWGSGHSIIINDYYMRLLNGKDIAVDGKQAIKTIKIIEAIYESSKMGKFVEL
jgi:UDP-N-acetyl-2-amino-2-deoxyglucuronate dehydrogenase